MKTTSEPAIKDGDFEVKEIVELNYFDLTGEKSNTKGASAKFYHAELQASKKNSNCQIFTMYGPTGRVQTKEWRIFDSEQLAKKEFDKIINSKKKKGYKEVDIAMRSLGSDEAKQITKPVILSNDKHLKIDIVSSLNDGQKRIIDIFFGSQAHFVATTLKCPLGQLSNKQIDDGRECLNKAKIIVNTKLDSKAILELTNEFYGLIPHNHGSGFRELSGLLLDTLDKIMQKEEDLDTLLDAKAIGAQVKNDTYDGKYKSLNAEFGELDKNANTFKFISNYFNSSKVPNHGFAREKISAIWEVNRRSDERDNFFKTIRKFSAENPFHSLATNKYGMKDYSPKSRPDLSADDLELYSNANVWLCWHGTRSANLVGITKKGLLIRPSGAVYTGSMFGDGKYFAHNSTKSLNYCDGGYYTGGRTNKKYMFLLDVGLGNVHKTEYSQYYRSPPKGHNSVFGKAGHQLKNDEMITYDTDPSKNQSTIRYLLEIT